MTDIVITEFMDEDAVAGLKSEFSVVYDPDFWNRRADLEKAMAGLPALIVRNRTKVDAALLNLGTSLKVVGRLGVGLDNIDVAHAKSKGIAVEAAIGSNASSVAEYVVAMSLVLLRGTAYQNTPALVGGGWPREAAGKGREIAGSRLGLIGYGSIGQVVAKLGRAAGMIVSAHDTFVPHAHPSWAHVERLDLDTLLASADVVSLHCPLTQETKGLIGPKQLARMKPGAILINSARGGIVDEAALVAALKSGHLGGAALDTFEPEPITAAKGALFAGLPNVILTPHIAGVTAQSNVRASTMTAASVRRILKGGA
jgi:(S)-sulfolactate dehydrogenase